MLLSPTETRPRTRHAHWQHVGDEGQLFVVNGSRIFDVGSEVLASLDAAALRGDDAVQQVLERIGVSAPAYVDDQPLSSPPLHAISLAIAQKCNLGCTYCYASEGSFGGAARNMPLDTAIRAVDMLIGSAKPGSRVHVTFLGGEPLTNRAGVRAATEHALERAAAAGVEVAFAITTNGTLLIADDAEFFEAHGFAVTVSLDGLRDAHDRQRPFKGGTGSFDRIMERVQPLLVRQRRMQVSVRATVTPGNLELRESLDAFLAMGFHSVGFSPVLRSPTGQGELSAPDYADLLNAMIECGLEFERHVLRGERYAFTNIVNALKELHHGTHRPYPCGAGAGYMGVSADGALAACHRFVGDDDGAMGDVVNGIDREAQNAWLAARHVHKQSPCGSCWARYMCSGGCHHEVIARGRPACDYIRGWLHYALGAHARLSRLRPDWFVDGRRNPV